MVKINDIIEIHTNPAFRNIKSLEQLRDESPEPKTYLKYFDMEARLKEDRIAPSLSAYLIYEYHVKGKSVENISKQFNWKMQSIMERMNIPFKTKSETQIKNDEQRQKLVDYVQQEIDNHKSKNSNRLSCNSELAELFGLSISSVVRYMRMGLQEDDRNYRTEILIKRVAQQNRVYIKGKDHPLFGRPVSKETRKKMSKRMTGKNNPNFGKPLTKEIKEKISQALIKSWARRKNE